MEQKLSEITDKAIPALMAMAEKLFRVVLIHHPPVSKAKQHKLLTDAAQFLNTIKSEGAELILHGHDPLKNLLQWDGDKGQVKSTAKEVFDLAQAGSSGFRMAK